MKKLTGLLIWCTLTAFDVQGQPKITFDKLQHDFGKVNEGDGAASHDFAFKNTGSVPLLIQDVRTTCGCTTPEWTRRPIRPGATGFITVSYDVKGRPGAIDKEITVYSNAGSAPVKLRIIGEVNPVDRHPSEAYRYTAGSIRLDDMHVSFKRVYSYEKPALTVTAYNPGPETVKISFPDLPAHIKAEVRPTFVKKGEKASIRVTYDAAKKNEWGFVSDRIGMVLNDNSEKDYKLTVTADIEEDFSQMTAAQLMNAPSATLDRTMVDAGKVKKGEKKEYRLTLTNSGKSKLLIRKAVSGSPTITVAAPKEVDASASADITVALDTSAQAGERNGTVTLITNDPKNAVITVRLKAEVTD